MIDIEIRDINNKTKGKISLEGQVFGNEASPAVVHSAVVSHLANQRQGTHSTKTKGLVSGGGKKPYKQKGTGFPRSTRSNPAPTSPCATLSCRRGCWPRRIPNSPKRAALCKALTMKLADNEIMVLDAIKIDRPRTKDMIKILDALGLAGQSVLLVLTEKDSNVLLSTRNIPAVDVARVADLNAYQVAAYGKLVFTEEAIKKLVSEEVAAA